MCTVIFFFCITVKEKRIDNISEEISFILGDTSDTENRLEKVLFAGILFHFKQHIEILVKQVHRWELGAQRWGRSNRSRI